MNTNHQAAYPGFEVASAPQNLSFQTSRARLAARHRAGWFGPQIKRLLVVAALALSLSAFAANPTATDAGRFIKVVGKQAITSAVEDEDIAFIRKNAIIRYECTKQQVNITLTSGSISYAFETREAAKAFLAQIAVFCGKEL